jgi:hypothetical protein
MDTFGKPALTNPYMNNPSPLSPRGRGAGGEGAWAARGLRAWAILLCATIATPFLGCSEKPEGQFQTYDHLKKSPAQATAESEPKKVAASSPATTTQPVEKPASIAKNTEPPKATKSTSATELKSQATSTPPTGTKVTDAAFQASVASAREKARAVPVSATTAPRKIQLLVPDRKFKTEGPEGAWRVSYDDLDLLKVLNMEPVPPDAATKMPDWLKGLEGKRVRIRGFMYPTFSQTGIHAFGLARDNQICCFGRNPKIYDVFDVQLRDGVTTDYLPNRPFDVVGVFHIRPEAEEGKLFHLYEMDDATVIAK